MLSQILSCFGKKLQSFQEEKKNWENISSHFDTVKVLGQLFSPFFYNLDNILET
jgi:hypothetical protein